MAKGKVGKTVDSLGDYLKEQRTASRLSLRQLADQAGVSNPYLSQIERGLRKPSAEVLNQIAKALRISAEQLYIRAGIVSPEEVPGLPERSVELAILQDQHLNERQKQSLLDVYASFLALHGPTEHASRSTHRDFHRAFHREGVSHMATTFETLKTQASKPLYAGVGVTDAVVEYVRDQVTEAQKTAQKLQKSVQKIDLEPQALRSQATTVVNARVDAISKDAKARRTAVEKRVAELQAEALALPLKVQATVNDTYGDLVVRGEGLVTRIRKQESTQATVSNARTTTAKAKTTKTQGAKATTTTADDHQEGRLDHQEDRRQEERSRQEQRQGDRHRGEEDRHDRHQGRRGRRREGRRLTSRPRDAQDPRVCDARGSSPFQRCSRPPRGRCAQGRRQAHHPHAGRLRTGPEPEEEGRRHRHHRRHRHALGRHLQRVRVRGAWPQEGPCHLLRRRRHDLQPPGGDELPQGRRHAEGPDPLPVPPGVGRERRSSASTSRTSRKAFYDSAHSAKLEPTFTRRIERG